jgi:GNAT superfamily N-acetyltransferase
LPNGDIVVSLADIDIRFGHLAERDTLEGILQRASLAWEERRDSLLAHPEVMVLPVAHLEQRRVRVAEIMREPVGFSVLLAPSHGISELDGLFVEPSRWRTGRGRALMSDAVNLARSENARAIEVTANACAEGFYAKFGFIRSGHAQTQLGPAIRMRYVMTDGPN